MLFIDFVRFAKKILKINQNEKFTIICFSPYACFFNF